MDAMQLFSDYRVRLERRGVSESALREYRVVSTRFMAFLGEQDLDVSDVRRRHVEDFFRSTGWSPYTQRNRVTWLRSPWKYWVHDLEVLDRSPFDGLRLELDRVPSREPVIVSTETLRAIKAGVRDAAEEALFHTFCYTGFRLLEVRRLTWHDISFRDQTVHIIGKLDKERTIPLHPALQEVLRRYGVHGQGSPFVFPGANGGQITHQGLSNRVHRLWGAYRARPHDFRRTFASSLTDNRVERPVIRQLMGHNPDDMTGLYVNFTMRRLHEEILKLYQLDPL